MIDKSLIDILACPETKQALIEADKATIDKVNKAIEKGKVFNRGGVKLTDKLQAGLICKTDQKFIYPIVDDIPVLLTSEALELSRINGA